MYKSIIVWLAEPVFPEDISQAVPLMYFFYLDSIINEEYKFRWRERGSLTQKYNVQWYLTKSALFKSE